MISRWSSPIPEITIWPVSTSVVTRNDGSSIASRSSAAGEPRVIVVGLGLDRDADHRARGSSSGRARSARADRTACRRSRAALARRRDGDAARRSCRPRSGGCPRGGSRTSARGGRSCSRWPLRRVEHRVADAQAARVDADERQRAAGVVVLDLERERGERLVVGDRRATASAPRRRMRSRSRPRDRRRCRPATAGSRSPRRAGCGCPGCGTPRRPASARRGRRASTRRSAARIGSAGSSRPATHAAISSSSSSAIASIIASRARLAAGTCRVRDRAVGELRAEARRRPTSARAS